MKLKLVSAISILLLSFFIFSACSSSNESTSSEVENGEEKIKIVWWDPQSLEPMVEGIENIIADYEKENPNVEIERVFVPFADIKDKLLLGAASGELPDIILIDGPDHQAFADAGVIADITEEINEWGEIDQYYEEILEATIYEGKNYGVPFDTNNLALYYNADMLDSKDVEPPTNWDELKDAAKKLTDEKVYGFSIAGIKSEQLTYQHLPFLWQAGSDLTNLDNQDTVNTLEYLKEFIDQGYMPNDILTQDQQATFMQFMSGNVAMVMSGPWQLPALKNEANFNWGLVPLPEGNEKATIAGGGNWAITEYSDHKDIAWDIVKFSQKPENLVPLLQAGGRMPVRKDIIEDPYWMDDEHMGVFIDQIDYSKARAYGANYPKISEAFQEMTQQIYTGSEPVDEAVHNASEKIKSYLE